MGKSLLTAEKVRKKWLIDFLLFVGLANMFLFCYGENKIKKV